MSERVSDPHGMGAISPTKPEGANAQPQTESGTAEPPPFPTAPKQLNVVFGNLKSFQQICFFVLEEFVIRRFQLNQELLGLLPGFYQELLVQPGSSLVNQ